MEQNEFLKHEKKQDIMIRRFCLLLIVTAIGVAFCWISYLKNPADCIWKMIVSNCAFLALFVTNAILLWKVFRTVSEKEEQQNDYYRKITWENFQYELHKAENEKRFEYEKEKFLYDKINKIADEFSKEKPVKNEVEKLEKAIEELKNQKEAQLIVEFRKSNNKTEQICTN